MKAFLSPGQIQNKNEYIKSKKKNKNDKYADRIFMETADAVANYFENNKEKSYKVTRALINPEKNESDGLLDKSPLFRTAMDKRRPSWQTDNQTVCQEHRCQQRDHECN